MEKIPKNPQFLDKKYQDLAGSKEVSRAVLDVKKREGGKIPHIRDERIEVYLERLEKYFGYKNDNEYIKGDERGFELLKNKILDKYVTKYKEIPESYYENIIRDSGRLGDWQHMDDEQKETFRAQNSEAVLADQRASLEEWIDYMSLKDSAYIPSELKYFIIRNVVQMSEYDKEKKTFGKRSVGTVQKFPDLNHEALGYLVDGIIQKWEGKEKEFEHDIQPEDREKFKSFVNKEDFQKLYAWCYENFKPIAEHLLPVTDGLWVKYNQNSNPKKLVESIRGKGTGWCTAGEQTAKTQLDSGDFYVYYTKDDDGGYNIPRIAIRKEGDSIAEVRGIAYKQNLDPYMGDILDKKLDEFPDKAKYIKKEKDNKELTKIDKKIKRGEDLTKSELVFLYEMNEKIDSFGYNDDPRIKELRQGRKVKEDQMVIFECTSDQIATNINEVNKNTKAYVGPLEKGIFEKMPTMEYIYTSFPDKRIQPIEIKSGIEYPKTKDEWVKTYKEKNIGLEGGTEDMLEKMEQTTLPENKKFVRLTVADLGFDSNAEYQKICERAEELGLELCAQDDGPKLRLSYDQPKGDYIRTAMKSIEVSDGNLRLWYLFRYVDGESELDWDDGSADDEWLPGIEFFFRVRKSTQK